MRAQSIRLTPQGPSGCYKTVAGERLARLRWRSPNPPFFYAFNFLTIRDDPARVGREHLQRHVLVEIDTADGLLLDRKFVFSDRLPPHPCPLRAGAGWAGGVS